MSNSHHNHEARVIALLISLTERIEYMSVEIDNANAALAALQTATAAAISKIDSLKAAPAGIDPAAVQAF